MRAHQSQGRDTDLRGTDLRRRKLEDSRTRGADLRGAFLAGGDLRDADLTGAQVWDADFTRADLSGADLNDIDVGPQGLHGRTRLRLAGAQWTTATRWPPALHATIQAQSVKTADNAWVVAALTTQRGVSRHVTSL
ncbi:pentapeptide repeat-containing protein [Streptomyces mirabilis]|uniref:pentapeptide repeat-containing protein n=1 Tax=Streptomyces mirabilis TaxID=68239 RepID=UPI0033208CBE